MLLVITETAGRSCCGPSGSSVLEFGFQLDFLVYTHMYLVDRTKTEF
jgi:hypothetical protein